ncbi:mCG146079, partial [Mus musculus]
RQRFSRSVLSFHSFIIASSLTLERIKSSGFPKPQDLTDIRHYAHSTKRSCLQSTDHHPGREALFLMRTYF